MDKEQIMTAVSKVKELPSMTVNERLYLTGLMDEFDKCKRKDKEKAKFILESLGVDETSIKRTLK